MATTEGAALVNERETLIAEFDRTVKEAKRIAKGIDKVTARGRWVAAVEKAEAMVEEVKVTPSGDDDEDEDLKRQVLADQIEREGRDPLLYKAVVAPSAPGVS